MGQLVQPPAPPLRPPQHPPRRVRSQPLPSTTVRGYESRPGNFRVAALHVSFFGTPTGQGEPDESPEYKRVAGVAGHWSGLVNDWLSALLRMPSAPLSTELGATIRTLRSDSTPTGSGGGVSIRSIVDAPAADLAQTTHAMGMASSGTLLPLEHQLLLSARNALYEDDVRRWVIDAATAAEISLCQSIEQSAIDAGLPRAFAESATKSANGVVGLFDTYRARARPQSAWLTDPYLDDDLIQEVS